MDDGLIFGGNTKDTHKAALGTQVNVKGDNNNTDWNKFDAGKNIMTKVDTANKTITVGLAKDLEVDNVNVTTNVTAGNVTATGNISAPTFVAGNTTITNGKVANLEHHIDNPTTVVDNKVVDISPKTQTEAATVRDVLNAGWNLQANSKAVDAVTHNDTVNFVNGQGVTISSETSTVKHENGRTTDVTTLKVAAKVADIKAGDNVTVEEGDKGVYTVSAKDTQASVTTEPNKGITVTPTTNANGTTNYKVTVDIDNDTITVNNQGKLVSNGATNFNVSTVDKGNQVANKGGSSTARVTSGKSVTYAAGKNIAIEQNGTEILVSTTEDVNHNSVTTNNLTVNEGGNLKVGPNSTVDMGGNQIHNVKAGEKDTDAVNVSQLRNNITNVNNRINKVQKEARGGIAGANAAAGLPQVYIPGKSMVAASAGTFKGESALAVGYSRSSDNGKVILKLQGNANTQGDVGGSVGVGYQW